MERVGELEIDQDLAFQEREWRTQRVGWVVLVMVMLVALGGLFGNGPLSWTTVTAPGGALQVSYERFGRRGGPQELTVRAPARSAERGSWHVEVSRDYLASLEVTSITPQPDAAEAVQGAVRYRFAQAAPDADLEVVLAVTPRAVGSRRGDVRLAGGQPATVTQFFFP